MSDETSARLQLPYLQPGQAQKELYHNEALALLDIAVQAVVLAVGQNAPPPSAALGEAWIVGTAPTDGWAGMGGAIAGWTSGGWRFVAPFEGLAVWSRADSALARYANGAWVVGRVQGKALIIDGDQLVGARQAAIGSPQGGGVVDAECRTALTSILNAMRAHGLIAP